MKHFFGRRKKKAKGAPAIDQEQFIQVDYDKIDRYILGKYGLQDIAKKEWFLLFNILFMLFGVTTVVMYLNNGITIVVVAGALVTGAIGYIITRMVKRYGVRKENKQDTGKEVK